MKIVPNKFTISSRLNDVWWKLQWSAVSGTHWHIVGLNIAKQPQGVTSVWAGLVMSLKNTKCLKAAESHWSAGQSYTVSSAWSLDVVWRLIYTERITQLTSVCISSFVSAAAVLSLCFQGFFFAFSAGFYDADMNRQQGDKWQQNYTAKNPRHANILYYLISISAKGGNIITEQFITLKFNYIFNLMQEYFHFFVLLFDISLTTLQFVFFIKYLSYQLRKRFNIYLRQIKIWDKFNDQIWIGFNSII